MITGLYLHLEEVRCKNIVRSRLPNTVVMVKLEALGTTLERLKEAPGSVNCIRTSVCRVCRTGLCELCSPSQDV